MERLSGVSMTARRGGIILVFFLVLGFGFARGQFAFWEKDPLFERFWLSKSDRLMAIYSLGSSRDSRGKEQKGLEFTLRCYKPRKELVHIFLPLPFSVLKELSVSKDGREIYVCGLGKDKKGALCRLDGNPRLGSYKISWVKNIDFGVPVGVCASKVRKTIYLLTFKKGIFWSPAAPEDGGVAEWKVLSPELPHFLPRFFWPGSTFLVLDKDGLEPEVAVCQYLWETSWGPWVFHGKDGGGKIDWRGRRHEASDDPGDFFFPPFRPFQDKVFVRGDSFPGNSGRLLTIVRLDHGYEEVVGKKWVKNQKKLVTVDVKGIEWGGVYALKYGSHLCPWVKTPCLSEGISFHGKKFRIEPIFGIGMETYLGNKNLKIPLILRALKREKKRYPVYLLFGLKGEGPVPLVAKNSKVKVLDPIGVVSSNIEAGGDQMDSFLLVPFPLPRKKELAGKILLFQFLVKIRPERIICSNIFGAMVRKKKWFGPGDGVWEILSQRKITPQVEVLDRSKLGKNLEKIFVVLIKENPRIKILSVKEKGSFCKEILERVYGSD